MTKTEITSGIYTCLEMLRAADRSEIADWWCGLLYYPNGDLDNSSWSESLLSIMENDCIYNIPLN